MSITPEVKTLTGLLRDLATRIRSLELRDNSDLRARIIALEARVTTLES